MLSFWLAFLLNSSFLFTCKTAEFPQKDPSVNEYLEEAMFQLKSSLASYELNTSDYTSFLSLYITEQLSQTEPVDAFESLMARHGNRWAPFLEYLHAIKPNEQVNFDSPPIVQLSPRTLKNSVTVPGKLEALLQPPNNQHTATGSYFTVQQLAGQFYKAYKEEILKTSQGATPRRSQFKAKRMAELLLLVQWALKFKGQQNVNSSVRKDQRTFLGTAGKLVSNSVLLLTGYWVFKSFGNIFPKIGSYFKPGDTLKFPFNSSLKSTSSTPSARSWNPYLLLVLFALFVISVAVFCLVAHYQTLIKPPINRNDHMSVAKMTHRRSTHRRKR